MEKRPIQEDDDILICASAGMAAMRGSASGRCEICDTKIMIAPSGVRKITAGYRAVCVPCGLKLAADSGKLDEIRPPSAADTLFDVGYANSN